MQAICGFKTTDGVFFETEEAAKKHQNELDKRALIDKNRAALFRLVASCLKININHEYGILNLLGRPISDEEIQELFRYRLDYAGSRSVYHSREIDKVVDKVLILESNKALFIRAHQEGLI